MKKILATVYDINPYKGSESGTGWNLVQQIGRYNKVIAITRKNNKENIEKYIKEFNIDDTNLEFHYFDLPYWMRFWKKGARGSSLYFYLWQMLMPIFIKKNKIVYDILHNLNFHTDAFPTFLWLLKKPLIWGPINHHELIPSEYINKNSNYYYKDRIKWIIKKINWNIDPFLFLSKKKSDLIICGNKSVIKRLNLDTKKTIIMSQVASSDSQNISDINKLSTKFNIISVGRFVPLKGFDLTVDCFELFYNKLNNSDRDNVTLTLVGDGPMKKELKKKIEKFNSKDNIYLIEWVTKDELETYYENSDLFLFPSYEGAGMVVAEALSHSLPIICFDNYGPGELTNDDCAIQIPYTNYDQSICDFSNALLKIYENKDLQASMSENARKLYLEKYTWDSKGDQLNVIYNKLSNKGSK
ncbi:hypothetical protein LPB137_10395 [Poseidonibacter parvus]|uniref:Glycosyl transferase family 1 domain-containing protein n=1 Tax=Poseidonibacter parvus TaxID=1850254 RepID=A0A1P8KNP8_9BACT|nr:glycosyltransferase [Poseidonibacter parvus]APW66224.1 hypothetical protein LPB137_10395 [Poseidonibacter parvus]